MSFRSPLAGLAGLFLLAVPFTARAQEEQAPRYPISASARPLAIGSLHLMLGADPGVQLGGAPGVYQVIVPLRFGFTDDLEFFAGPVLQTVDPKLRDPSIGLLYRLVRGPIEIALRAAGELSLFGAVQTARVQIGVPFRIHAGDRFSFDLGANVLVSALPQGRPGALIPAGISLNITDALFIAAGGALRVEDLASAGAFTIPASATLGYTFAWGDQPFIDLAARAAWNDLRGAVGTFSVGPSVRLYVLP